jgi:hypothetical protein
MHQHLVTLQPYPYPRPVAWQMGLRRPWWQKTDRDVQWFLFKPYFLKAMGVVLQRHDDGCKF